MEGAIDSSNKIRSTLSRLGRPFTASQQTKMRTVSPLGYFVLQKRIKECADPPEITSHRGLTSWYRVTHHSTSFVYRSFIRFYHHSSCSTFVYPPESRDRLPRSSGLLDCVVTSGKNGLVLLKMLSYGYMRCNSEPRDAKFGMVHGKLRKEKGSLL